jgi:hypothetical protein
LHSHENNIGKADGSKALTIKLLRDGKVLFICFAGTGRERSDQLLDTSNNVRSMIPGSVVLGGVC